jgi:hypothetical protein
MVETEPRTGVPFAAQAETLFKKAPCVQRGSSLRDLQW